MELGLNDFNAGFLGGEQEGAMELMKAMQAGAITGRETANLSLSQEPLKAESLEKTLKLLEFRQKDIRLLNAMPKMTAYNTVEEFMQLTSYGSERGGFYNEGELSDVEDSTYVRRAQLVKYLQVTGEVTMQAQMVRSYVDAMRQEVENKVMWITRTANRAMTKGNSAYIPQEWNGLYAQHAAVGTGDGFLYADLDAYHASDVVIDMRGKSLKQEDVETGAVRVDNNYGNVSHLFAPTQVLSALSKDYFQDQRIMMNGGGYEGKIGTVAKSIATTIGDVDLSPDKFLAADKSKKLIDAATTSKAPAAVVSVSNALAVDASSAYEAGEVGTVYYAVSAINRYGESALTQIGAAVILAVGSSVDLTFTPGVGANAATAFKVYRTKVGAATTDEFFPIFTVSVSERTAGFDGAVASKVRDRGRYLPDTEQAFLTEMIDDVLSFKQLAPVSKLDLAVLSMSRRFITFLFGTPNLYSPKKFVRFINCAKTLTA